MLHSILAHWKASTAAALVLGLIGLLADSFTAPKVLAAMVFLSDWGAVLTPEWWLRTIGFGVVSLVIWWFQKRKYQRMSMIEMANNRAHVKALQGALRHTEQMLATAQTRIDILSRRNGAK